MATKVVVGVSPSLAGLQALRYAVNLARERAGTVHAVRVWLYKPMWRDTTTTFERRVHRAEAELLIPYAFDAAMGGMPADVPVRPVVVEGLAGHGLIEEAADEVTRFCVRHAHCPVVVVPPPPLAQAQPVDALLRELGRDLAG